MIEKLLKNQYHLYMENNEKNTNKYKFLPLSPKVIKGIDGEISSFRDCLDDDHYYNIALVSPYGGGKSSFIKSVTDKYADIKGNFLIISFAKFASHVENVTEQDIERSILQQLLYRTNSSQLPLSRITKLEQKKNKIRVFLEILFWALVAIGLTSIVLFGLFFYDEKSPYTKFLGLNFLYLLIPIIIPLCACLYIAFHLKIFSSLKIKDIEFDFSTNSNNCSLDEYLDEIVYFFGKMPYKYVVFEDIERFKNLLIFEKLRLLNNVLNNSNIKKKIVFIYSVCNDLFKTSEERTKFFDLIFSIPPFVSAFNSEDVLLLSLKEANLGNVLSKDYIFKVAPYFTNPRTINSTINETIQYLNFYKEKEDKKAEDYAIMIFSLMAIKNLYPEEYVSIEKNDDSYFNLLESNCQEEIARKQKANSDNIEKLKDELLQVNESGTIEELKERISGIIYLYGSNSGNAGTSINVSSVNVNTDFDAYSFIIINFNNPYGGSYVKKMSITDINLKLGYSLANKIKYIKQNTLEEKETIRNKISQLEVENEKEFTDIFKYSRENPRVFEGMDDLDPLGIIRMLIVNGFINSHYKEVINYNSNSFFDDNTRKFINNLNENKTNDALEKIQNVDVIIRKIPEADFTRKGILNVYIVKELLKGKKSSKRRTMHESLFDKSEESNNFIIKVIEKGFENYNDYKNVILYFMEFYSILLEIVLDHSNFPVELFTKLLVDGDSFLKQQELIEKYVITLEENSSFANNISSLSNKALEFLFARGYKVLNLEGVKNLENKVVEKYSLWEININNFKFLCKKYLDVQDDVYSYSSIEKLPVDIKDYISKNIDKFAINVLDKVETYNFTEDQVSQLFLDSNISTTAKVIIVDKLTIKIKYDNKFEKELVDKLISKHILQTSIDNLASLVNDENIIDIFEMLDKDSEYIISAGHFDNENVQNLFIHANGYANKLEVFKKYAIHINNAHFNLFKIEDEDMFSSYLVINKVKPDSEIIKYIKSKGYRSSAIDYLMDNIIYIISNKLMTTSILLSYLSHQSFNVDVFTTILNDDYCLSLINDKINAEKVLKKIYSSKPKINIKVVNKISSYGVDKNEMIKKIIKSYKINTPWEIISEFNDCFNKISGAGSISLTKSEYDRYEVYLLEKCSLVSVEKNDENLIVTKI